MLAEYRVGSVLSGSAVLSGIIEESERWRRNYNKLFNDITKWHEHLARNDEPEHVGEGADKRRALRRFLQLPEQILNSHDPLAALIAMHKHTNRETDSH